MEMQVMGMLKQQFNPWLLMIRLRKILQLRNMIQQQLQNQPNKLL
jgi:hypothetical protein